MGNDGSVDEDDNECQRFPGSLDKGYHHTKFMVYTRQSEGDIPDSGRLQCKHWEEDMTDGASSALSWAAEEIKRYMVKDQCGLYKLWGSSCLDSWFKEFSLLQHTFTFCITFTFVNVFKFFVGFKNKPGKTHSMAMWYSKKTTDKSNGSLLRARFCKVVLWAGLYSLTGNLIRSR